MFCQIMFIKKSVHWELGMAKGEREMWNYCARARFDVSEAQNVHMLGF
jgi:hypothetical protein